MILDKSRRSQLPWGLMKNRCYKCSLIQCKYEVHIMIDSDGKNDGRTRSRTGNLLQLRLDAKTGVLLESSSNARWMNVSLTDVIPLDHTPDD